MERPDDWLKQRQTRDIVKKKIAELPDNCRIVLLLRDIEQFSTIEAATLLEVQKGQVAQGTGGAEEAALTVASRVQVTMPNVATKLLRFVKDNVLRHLPDMIPCIELEDFIQDYIEGRLPADGQRKFELRIRFCQECRECLQACKRAQRLAREALCDTDQELPEILRSWSGQYWPHARAASAVKKNVPSMEARDLASASLALNQPANAKTRLAWGCSRKGGRSGAIQPDHQIR